MPPTVSGPRHTAMSDGALSVLWIFGHACLVIRTLHRRRVAAFSVARCFYHLQLCWTSSDRPKSRSFDRHQTGRTPPQPQSLKREGAQLESSRIREAGISSLPLAGHGYRRVPSVPATEHDEDPADSCAKPVRPYWLTGWLSPLITWSRLKLAGVWLGGNSLKLWSHCPTKAWAGTTRKARSIRQ
jgi:hypothetical protein